MKISTQKNVLHLFGYLTSVCFLASHHPLLAKTVGLSSSPVANQLLAQQPNCNNPQTQFEMNACAGESWQRADQELNRVYQLVRPKLPNARRQKLVNAQTAWIKFRDSECDFSGSFVEGGSMQPMIEAGCREEITSQRTADLKSYLQGRTLPSTTSSYQRVDTRLNQIYQQLRKSLAGAGKRKLEVAETAWIRFRDTSCDFERTAGVNTAYSSCLTRMTEQRIRQLEAYLEQTSL